MTGSPDGPTTDAPPPDGEPADSAPRGSWIARWARVVMRLVDEKARRKPSPRVERILLAVSFVAFVVLGVLAIKNFPDVAHTRWGILLAAGILGQCASLVFNAGEFAVTARFVGQRVPMHRAMRVTIIGSAANLLPLPGGALVRVQALAADGARYRHSLTAAAAIGVTSVGSTFIVVGLANTGTAGTWTVLGLIALGIVVIAIAAAMLRTAAPSSRRAARYSLYFVLVEAGYAIMASFRMWGIFQGLGVHVSIPAAFALSGVGSIATAASFFPGELGIKELIVGLVSPLVGVKVAVGITGAVVTRLFGFAILAVAASSLFVGDFIRRSRHHRPGTDAAPTDEEVLPPIPEIDTEMR